MRHALAKILNLGPAVFIGAGGQGVEPAAIYHHRGEFVPVAILSVHCIFEVVEGVTIHLAFSSLNQFSGSAASSGGNHFAA